MSLLSSPAAYLRNQMRPGRSSLGRGLLALFLAPALASLPVGALFLLQSDPAALWAYAGQFDMARDLFDFTPVMVRVTLLLGLPAWGVLRLIRRESGLSYALTGAAEGLAAALAVSYGFTDGVRADQIPIIVLACGSGLLIALLFWLIARDPKATPP